MATPPLGVALVWHMHQPWYRDDVAGLFVLPWVRRRASKDYLHMLRVLERHPQVRVTMNMVPSLLAQLQLYADGHVADADRDLCLRDADELTRAEREFLVAGAQRNDYGRRVALLAPFMALLDGLAGVPAAAMATSDIRDLQVWNLLAWIDPDDIRGDPQLASLAGRGRGFQESDKATVDARQLALLREVIPALRAAVESESVEPMTTPFHHPILPLLIDSNSALVASPSVAVPNPALRAPGEAETQVRRGLGIFAHHAGRGVAGMWSPECAVSPESASLLSACGVSFTVADEAILARTLGRQDVRRDGELYAAHRDASGLSLVFRDAQLSNLVGFSYQAMPAASAAADLIGRLEDIAGSLPDDGVRRLATIALDGENFKDFYEENGTPFLEALYAGLVASPRLTSTHIGTHLAEVDRTGLLPPLWTGSWIDADLRTWIGDEAHTRAWSILRDALSAVDGAGGAAAHPRAHEELLIAQASDWFWWFGDRHDSGDDGAWDALFRTHLRNAYGLAGLPVPDSLDELVITRQHLGGDCAPLRWIDPSVLGLAEWGCAGVATVGVALGSMRPPASSVERILYGAGGGRLHLRFGDGKPRYDRAVVDAGATGRVVVGRPVRNVSIAVPAGPVDLAVTLDEWARGSERVPATGTLHVESRAEPPPRVLIVAVECAPLAVAGDLASRVAAAAAEAARQGHDVVVVIPGHRGANPGEHAGVRLEDLGVLAWGRTLLARVVQGAVGEARTPVLSIEVPSLFDRDAIYGAADDGDRYLAFCALVDALLDATGFAPDVVHAFEWQTAALVARLGARPGSPVTVFSAAPNSPSFSVSAETAAGIGLDPTGPGEVDLLELGRGAATLVEQSPSGDPGAVYAAALEIRASASPRLRSPRPPVTPRL